jgi:dTDP-4-dehydrorhamnose 3,5-epimerase
MVPTAASGWACAASRRETAQCAVLAMNAVETELPGVWVLEPRVFGDQRGWFLENWRDQRFAEAGLDFGVAQVNTSHSGFGVLRGLHFQWPQPQGKLVWVSAGRVFDVAVDIRADSPRFGDWVGVELDAEAHRQLWIPEGFAHGFQVLSESATFSYLCTRAYHPEFDSAIVWNDPDIAVEWPHKPVALSSKDAAAPRLNDLSRKDLPSCESC